MSHDRSAAQTPCRVHAALFHGIAAVRLEIIPQEGQQYSTHRPGQNGGHATLALSECRRSADVAPRDRTAICGRLVWGRRHRQRRRPHPATAMCPTAMCQAVRRVWRPLEQRITLTAGLGGWIRVSVTEMRLQHAGWLRFTHLPKAVICVLVMLATRTGLKAGWGGACKGCAAVTAASGAALGVILPWLPLRMSLLR